LRREAGGGFTTSEPYGCTFGDISYLGKREFKKLMNTEEKALALIHERLHTLRPYQSEFGEDVTRFYSDPVGSGNFHPYSFYPELNQNIHRWIAPFTAGAAQAFSSGLNPAVRADAQTIELLKSVSARICLTYFDSGCSDTNAYDPVDQVHKQDSRYCDKIFREGLNAHQLRLKKDILLTGTGKTLGSFGEKCLLSGPRSYETSVTLKKGMEFTMNFDEGSSDGWVYFPSLELIEKSTSTKYEVICETSSDERGVVRAVQEIRSAFDLVP
jgi:hypothetical protein